MSASGFTIQTELGNIVMKFRPDAAPQTVDYYFKTINSGVFSASTFYRSDFVIQCGLHGTGREPPLGNLTVNETSSGPKVSNTRGTAAVAHWDVPDCGNTEFFINLQTNAHLDDAYGGYCVFAEVADQASFGVVDSIATAIKNDKPTVAIGSIRAH